MAQLDRPQRRDSPRTTPNSPTIEQLLREADALPWSASPRRRDSDEEYGQPCHQKKSVLTKVKEKAKKLKHSLSLKKKHNNISDHNHHDDRDLQNATPSWGVSLEDECGQEELEEDQEDAEYLGAPMYESEYAPEIYKATARQQPKAAPAISDSEKHVAPISTTVKEANSAENNPHSPNNKLSDQNDQSNLTETLDQKTLQTPSTEKLGPTDDQSSKTQGVTMISSPQKSSASTSQAVETGVSDKGVSVKDYLLNKFELAEEDRAPSRAISKAMTSPRSIATKISSNNASDSSNSVVEKVREAVASLLRNDQPRSPPSSPSKAAVLMRSTTKTSIPRYMPVATNAREVEEEQNLGRVLQTN